MGNGAATFTTALATTGLTWLVQSTILLAAGLMAGRLLKRAGAAVQSGVYRTTLAAVLVCPFASAALTAAGYDGFTFRLPNPATGEAVTAEHQTTAPLNSTSATATRFADALTAAVEHPEPLPRLAIETRIEPAVGSAPAPAHPSPIAISTYVSIPAIAMSVWLLGAAVMVARLLVGQRRMTRLRATAVPAEPAALGLCRDLAARMGVVAPAVLRSPFLCSPCLDGLRRPVILLPEDAGDNLRETFIHELAHLARRDALWNLLRRSSMAVLWVQPLLWVLSRRLEGAAEEVCDDYVVQFGADRTHYAGHLLELAGRALPPVAPAGVGMISLRSMLARRIVRLLDTSRALSTRAGTRAVLAMLVVGLAGTVLAGLLGVGSGKDEALAQLAEAKPDAKDEPKSESKGEVVGGQVVGQVVGPDGKPVPGAKVTAWRVRANPLSERFRPKSNWAGMGLFEYARTTADPEGRFEVGFVGDPEPVATAMDRADGISVIATAPGFGVGYYLKDKPIRLSADDQPVNGRLVDLEGRPVEGARLRIFHVWVPEPAAQRDADARNGPYEFPQAKSVGIDGEPMLPGGVVTDADGRFRIEGLGRDVRALLEVSGPNVALKRFTIISRAKGPIASEPHQSGYGRQVITTIYGADCTVPVEPTRPIEGVVRDIETKQPIPGAIVTAHRLSGSNFGIDGLIRTETDAQGRYRLIGLPKEGAVGHQLAVYPPIDRPYFVTDDIAVPASPGLEPVKFDIALRRATWATGTVKDVKTGKPVANVLIDYFPMLSNERAKDYPNFDPKISGSVAVKTHHRTDREGRFRVTVLHGRGVITARAELGAYRTGFGAEAIPGRSDRDQLMTYDHIYPAMYHGLREIDVPKDSNAFSCDVPLDPGGSLKVRLVDTTGKPVTTATLSGRLPESIDLNSDMRGESVAKIGGLEPGKPRTLVAEEMVRKIGAVLTVPLDGSKDGDEITVTLRPNASLIGRVVDEAGKPAAGYIQVSHIPAVRQFHAEVNVRAGATVDADGRFRCDNLPPGGSFRVWLINHEGSMARAPMKSDPFQPFELADKLTVEPGQVVDLGTYNVATGKRVEPPAAKAEPADAPINGPIVDGHPDATKASITVTGRAVDETGQPIAGATIYLQSTNGIDARLGATATDENGRYEFRDAKLPVRSVDDGPVQGTFQVYGTAPGKGFTWHGMRFLIVGRRENSPRAANEDDRIFSGEPIEMNLTFRPPARLRGRVIDHVGVPVAGATVSLGNADWLDTKGKEQHQNFREFWCISAAPPAVTTTKTGDDGRFEIPGLPSEAGFWVHIKHPEYAGRNLFYASTNRPTTEFDYPHVSYLPERPKVETGELTVEFVSTRRLSIRVLEGTTKEPAPGISVHIGVGPSGTYAYGITDANGSVVLKLPPGEYPVGLDPPRRSDYIRTSARIRVEDQPQDQAAEFRIDAGCILLIEAVDAESGKGVPGVNIMEERVVNGQPRLSALQISTTHVENSKTDNEGRLRAVVRPARMSISLGFNPAGYDFNPETKTVDGAAGETVRVRFELRRRGKEK